MESAPSARTALLVSDVQLIRWATEPSRVESAAGLRHITALCPAELGHLLRAGPQRGDGTRGTSQTGAVPGAPPQAVYDKLKLPKGVLAITAQRNPFPPS